MRALRVGCDGSEGSVGEGWPSVRSGTVTFWLGVVDEGLWLLRNWLLLPLLPLLGWAVELELVREFGKTETEAARG
jgi:hypothetical protein